MGATMAAPQVVGRATTAETRFHALFKRHYGDVVRYAIRRVGADDADDVAEDVFAVVWRRIDRVPDGAGALPWIYGVARRVTANHHRASRRRRRLWSKAAGEETVATHPDPRPELIDALARLGSRDREVLELRAWEGLEPREMAEVLGCSVNAATVRLHRARRRLAAELGPEGGER
jgi:RNA polymerase sigma-70 factor (ECF subfamily)